MDGPNQVEAILQNFLNPQLERVRQEVLGITDPANAPMPIIDLQPVAATLGAQLESLNSDVSIVEMVHIAHSTTFMYMFMNLAYQPDAQAFFRATGPKETFFRIYAVASLMTFPLVIGVCAQADRQFAIEEIVFYLVEQDFVLTLNSHFQVALDKLKFVRDNFSGYTWDGPSDEIALVVSALANKYTAFLQPHSAGVPSLTSTNQLQALTPKSFADANDSDDSDSDDSDDSDDDDDETAANDAAGSVLSFLAFSASVVASHARTVPSLAVKATSFLQEKLKSNSFAIPLHLIVAAGMLAFALRPQK